MKPHLYTVRGKYLFVDGYSVFHKGRYACGTPYKHRKEATQELCDIANKAQYDEYPLTIHKFEYNGFMGRDWEDKILPYKAKFIKWTDDAGIALCKCSDGKERLIPSFAMDIPFILPDRPDTPSVMFGTPSKS